MIPRAGTGPKSDIPVWTSACLLGAALVFGASPIWQAAAHLAAAALCAAWLVLAPAGLRAVPRRAWLLAGLIVAVPLAQLVPLPPSLWHSLPGRGLEAEALGLIGRTDSWRPLSLAPGWTLVAALQMVMGAALLVMVSALAPRGRLVMLAVVVGGALLSLLPGIDQVAGLSGTGGHRFLIGFQTYHNDEAMLLLLALLALAALVADLAAHTKAGGSRRILLATGLALGSLLVLGLVLTASRTGMLLLLPTLVAACAIVRPVPGLAAIQPARAGLALALLAVLGALLVWSTPSLMRAVGRFAAGEESRPEIWHQSLWLLRAYAPWGSGIGSFMPLFLAAEPLEAMGELRPDHAHNDYLQLLIEGGLPAVACLAAALWLLGRLAWQGRMAHPANLRGAWLFAICALGLLAVHALVDFPLRSESLACIAALCAGLLMPVKANEARGEG